jgi:hypothetical protein
VIDGGRDDQDEVVGQVASHFSTWTGRASKVVDRRRVPTHGYRAVHVIVFPEGIPVEIQVRTELQNHWAQLVEGLGDRWGRAIRYGGPPEFPDRIVGWLATSGRPPASRRIAIRMVRRISNDIDFVEEACRRVAFQNRSSRVSALRNAIAEKISEVTGDGGEDEKALRSLYQRVRRTIKYVLGVRRMGRRQVGRFVRRRVPAGAPATRESVADGLRLCQGLVDDTHSWEEDGLRHREEHLRVTLDWMNAHVRQGGVG